MTYEVQKYSPTQGWINDWFCADDFDRLEPETFATRNEAEAALREHLEDLDAQVAAGQLAKAPSPWEFRVQYVFLTPLPAIRPSTHSQENRYD